jgi:hypothetical protein
MHKEVILHGNKRVECKIEDTEGEEAFREDFLTASQVRFVNFFDQPADHYFLEGIVTVSFWYLH